MKCVYLLIALSVFVCDLDAQRWGVTNGRVLRREAVVARAQVNQAQIREVTYVSLFVLIL